MPPKTTNKPELQVVAEYLRSYVKGAIQPPVDSEGSVTTTVSRDHGNWTYSYGTPGLDEFNRVVTHLHEKHAQCRQLSIKALQECLYGALNIVADGIHHSESDPRDHIPQAIEHVRSVLSEPLQDYECWLQVTGIEPQSLPLTLGNISFSHLRSTARNASRMSLHNLHSSLPSSTLRSIQDHSGSGFIGTTVGICHPQARDVTAAMEQADEMVRSTIECLNFLIDLVEPGRASVSLLSQSTSAGESSRLLAALDGRSTMHSWQKRSPILIPIEGWRNPATSIGEAFSRIDGLLRNHNLNPVESLLLSAVRWAGRAVAATSPQDAFLFSAIALECLTIPSSNTELTYRLSHRVACLLEDGYEERLRVAEKVKYLYSIRSKIVHSGDFSASIELQHEMRDIVTQTIIRVLNNSRICRSKGMKDLDKYFEELVLS